MKTIYLIYSKQYPCDCDRDYELSPEFAVEDVQVADKLISFLNNRFDILEQCEEIPEPNYKETKSYVPVKGMNLTEVDKIVIKAQNKEIAEYNSSVAEYNKNLRAGYEEKVRQEEARVINNYFNSINIPEDIIGKIKYLTGEFEVNEITLY